MNWSSFFAYEATYWSSIIAMTLGFSMRLQGRRNFPRRGPVLLIANHQSFFDPILLGLAVRRHLSFLARRSLFDNPVFGRAIRLLNAVPIQHDGLGIEGLRAVLAQLQAGRAVVVFPEGERTWNGSLQALQPGIQLLIKRTRAPIIPVGIAGAFHAWPRTRPLPVPAPLFLPPEPGTIAVAVGRSLDVEQLAELPRPQLLQTLYDALHEAHQEAETLRRKPR